MSSNQEYGSIEELLAEADELVQQVNSDVIMQLEEAHRLKIEKHALELKKIKSEVKAKIGKKKKSEKDSGAEGIHEAILDIMKAMQGLKDKPT